MSQRAALPPRNRNAQPILKLDQLWSCLPQTVRQTVIQALTRMVPRDHNDRLLLGILHHPVYAGAYVYGRRETNPKKVVPGKPGRCMN